MFKMIPCPICPMYFGSKTDFEAHKANAHPSHKYKSFVCKMGDCKTDSKNFGTDWPSFHDHQFWAHGFKREYQCNQCPKLFTNAFNQKRHEETVHGSYQKGSFVCGNCEKVYKSHKTLANHLPKCGRPTVRAPKRRAETNPESAPKAARLDFEDLDVGEPTPLDEIQPSLDLPPTPPPTPPMEFDQNTQEFQLVQASDNVFQALTPETHQDQGQSDILQSLVQEFQIQDVQEVQDQTTTEDFDFEFYNVTNGWIIPKI